MKLTIVNRSPWPDAAIRIIAKWVVKREGIDWPYTVTVRSCEKGGRDYGGRGWRCGQRIWLKRHYRRTVADPRPTLQERQAHRQQLRNRLAALYRKERAGGYVGRPCTDLIDQYARLIVDVDSKIMDGDYSSGSRPLVGGAPLWPLTVKDHRFQWSTPEVYHSRLDVLVMLLAHEAHHATEGHPQHYREHGRTNSDLMEFRCNKAGAAAVADFRQAWPALRQLIREALRIERFKRRTRIVRTDPSRKLARAQAALATWQRKLKLATTKVRKYRTAVRRYEGKVAAKQ